MTVSNIPTAAIPDAEVRSTAQELVELLCSSLENEKIEFTDDVMRSIRFARITFCWLQNWEQGDYGFIRDAVGMMAPSVRLHFSEIVDTFDDYFDYDRRSILFVHMAQW